MLKIFPNTSVLPPQMTKRPAADGRTSNVRFGVLSEKQLEPYREVLNEWGSPQYKPNNLADIQDTFLSVKAKERLERIHGQIGDTGKFKSLYKRGDLEPMGYASNMLFELYTLVALREKVISKDFIKEFANQNKNSLQSEKGYEDFLKQIQDKLKTYDKRRKSRKIERFQHLIGGDAEQARAVLNLVAARLILQQRREPKVDLFKMAKANLKSEAANFNSTFPWHSLQRIKTWLTTVLYYHLPFLPVEWFRSHLLSTIQGRVGREIEYQDLMKSLKDNQCRRLEVEYANPNLPRHHITGWLHGMEMMNTAVIVENAKLGRYRD